MTRIENNASFAYGDALNAAIFAQLAYKHRASESPTFASRVTASGWQGISLSGAAIGDHGYSPAQGGYGVQDGLNVQSFAFAGKRTAADQSVQFVVSFEGSNVPPEELLPTDWLNNAGQYGWSRYYASLMPLMTEVVSQMLSLQQQGKQTQLILTGHSLGGAAAMAAYADLLAPQGNLWPGSSPVLKAGQRLFDSIGDWGTATRQRVLDATTVYTYGAPSFLIEPGKLTLTDLAAFAGLAASSWGNWNVMAAALLARTIGALSVDAQQLPDLSGLGGNTFPNRAFQFEHANSSWYYPGDIVAQLGNQDPGTVLEINLDNDRHKAYTNLLSRFAPGGTHSIDNYLESVIRLAADEPILKTSNPLATTSPALPLTAAGAGSNSRNDFFVNSSTSGLDGNDSFIFKQAGNYTAHGDRGNDLYSLNDYNINLTLDGSLEHGRDTILFDISGDRQYTYDPSNNRAIFSVTGSNGFSSSVTINSANTWLPTDIFQINKPSSQRWTALSWSDIYSGQPPVISVSTTVPAPSPSVSSAPPSTGATKEYARASIIIEPRSDAYATADLSINDLIDRLSTSDRSNFLTTVTVSETNDGGFQSTNADSYFYRLSKNRFAIEATLATGVLSSNQEANLLAFLKNISGEGNVSYEKSDVSFTLGASGKSVNLVSSQPESASLDAIVTLKADLISKPSALSSIGMVVLRPGEDSSSLSHASIRERGTYVISSLSNQEFPTIATPLALSNTLGLCEGQSIAFFEISGDSIATAGNFKLIDINLISSQRLQLRTSLGMVLEIVAEGANADPGLTAYLAKDQDHAPVLNCAGFKVTDVITGTIVLGREADYSTNAGFYRIEDFNGAVRDVVSGNLIQPGESGYTKAALQLSIGALSGLSVADNQTTLRSFSLSGNDLAILAPFAVVNDGSILHTYFSFAAANHDLKQHFRMIGENIWGFEDMPGLGDNDGQDLILGLTNLTLA